MMVVPRAAGSWLEEHRLICGFRRKVLGVATSLPDLTRSMEEPGLGLWV